MKRMKPWLAILAAGTTLSAALTGPGLFAQSETSYTDVPSGSFLADYTVTGDVGKIVADTVAGAFISAGTSGTVYLDLCKADGSERHRVAPAPGDKLYYDFTVSMVEHDGNDENHAYHGKASLNPAIWAAAGGDIGAAFMSGAAAGAGVSLFDGSLPAGTYTGALDLSAVWGTEATTDCISLHLGEYTRVDIRAMKFVRASLEMADMADGDFLASYKAGGDIDKAIIDTAAGTLTNNSDGRIDLLLDLMKGEERHQIFPVEGARLQYDLTVTGGGAYIIPDAWTDAGGYNFPVGDAFVQALNDNAQTGGGASSLSAGDYRGTVDLSAKWPVSKSANCVVVRLEAGASVTLRTLKFVVPSGAGETEDAPGGNLLEKYALGGDDIGRVAYAGNTFVSAEQFGTMQLTLPEETGIVPAEGDKLYVDLTVSMVAHREDDENHGYHGKASLVPAIPGDDGTAAGSLLESIAALNGASLYDGTLPAGTYTGAVTPPAGWSADKAAAGLTLHLNEFTRVDVRAFKLVRESGGEPKPPAESRKNGNLLAGYLVNVESGGDTLTYDAAANRFTAGSENAVVYLKLQKDGAAHLVYPAAGEKLLYDVAVAMTDHAADGESPDEHAYHGKAYLSPMLLGDESPYTVGNALTAAMTAAKGNALYDSLLPAENYTGSADVSAVWAADKGCDCLLLKISAYTQVELKDLRFAEEKKPTKTIADGDKTYTYADELDLGMTDMYDALGAYEPEKKEGETTYTRSDQAGGWISEANFDREMDFAGYDPYVYYDFTIAKGGVALSQNFTDASVNLSALLAEKHGVSLVDGDKLPAGTYTGVVKADGWPDGAIVMKTLSAWSTADSAFTARALRLLNVTQVTDGSEIEPPEPPTPPAKTITDGDKTYTYADDLDLGITDMYDALGAYEPEKKEGETTYTRGDQAGGWISEANFDREMDFAGYDPYVYYDFTIAKGGVALSQNFPDASVNLSALLAEKHGVSLVDGDKLPAGTYTGVIKADGWPDGAIVMKTLSAWSTADSAFTARALRLLNVTKVTGGVEPPKPQKVVLCNLLPASTDKWSKEFEARNAVITGSLEAGWRLAVPADQTNASARGYFDYTAIGANSFLLSYDFTIAGGEAAICLRAGLRPEGEKDVPRVFSNGKDTLVLTPYIAAVAGVKPVADPAYGEDRLPAGHYQGVIKLDGAIPAAFKTEGYSWWDCGLTGANTIVTFRELAFVKGVEVSDSPHTGDSRAIVPVALAACAAGLAAVCGGNLKRKRRRV